jgi:thiamine-monophosphate kinase
MLAEQCDLVEELYDGISELARLTGTHIVGGDTVRTPGPLVLNVALIGVADPERLLRRSGARPGDLLVVTGTVGASAAGLAILLAGDPATFARPEAGPLLAAHHHPLPQLEVGAALAASGVRCAIDVSDGVASEAWHLARASGVEIEVDVDRLPLAGEAVALLGAARTRELALTGGEDYQLLFAVPESRLAAVTAALPPHTQTTVIGRVLGKATGGSARFLDEGRVVDLAAGPGYVAF